MRSPKGIALIMTAFASMIGYTQVPFTLDTTFRTQLTQRNVNSILLLASGEVLLSGIMRFPGDMSDRLMSKVDQNGDRVPTFPFTYGGGRITPWSGMLYVANGQGVRRLMLDGSLDNSFNMIGVPYLSSLQGGDYHVYPDGRLLLGGTYVLSDTVRGFVGNYNLVWLTNQGYLDTTRTHKRGNGPIYRFGQYLDGGFLCSGNASMYEGQPVDKIFRVDSLGGLDTAFHSHVYLGRAYSFLPMSDGRMYATGRFWRTDATTETIWVGRFKSDGSLDPVWVSPQFDAGAIPDVGSNGPVISNILPYQDGKCFVMGNFQFVNGEPRRGICVLDSLGNVGPEFDDCGVEIFTSTSLTTAAIYDIKLSPDSLYWYVGGAYAGYNDQFVNDTLQRFISRLHVGDISTSIPLQPPSPMPSFRLQPNPASTSVAFNYALNSNVDQGRIIVRDLSGRTLETIRFSGQEGQRVLDTRDLVAGVYTVEFFNGSDLLHTEKLIIQP